MTWTEQELRRLCTAPLQMTNITADGNDDDVTGKATPHHNRFETTTQPMELLYGRRIEDR
jgi:hypothetical protein